MLDEFRKRESKGLYFKKNGHFNAKGHREVADILSSKVLRLLRPALLAKYKVLLGISP